MESDEIIQKTLEIYSGDKNHVSKYLKHYIPADSKYKYLCRNLGDRLSVFTFSTGKLSKANIQHLMANLGFDEQTIFDSFDNYQFGLNKNIY